jgi:SAM-dependent methyltransferase
VFEFGVGTGRFAENLLRNYLSPDCRYFGIDVSLAMIEIAGDRLRPWSDRASVHLYLVVSFLWTQPLGIVRLTFGLIDVILFSVKKAQYQAFQEHAL